MTHSFPTRRSSDLLDTGLGGAGLGGAGLGCAGLGRAGRGCRRIARRVLVFGRRRRLFRPLLLHKGEEIRPRISSPLCRSKGRKRTEEHTSELQSIMAHLVCRLLLEKKKKKR